MAALSAISKYLASVILCFVLILAVPSRGIYVRDRSSRQKSSRNERVRERARDASMEERRRDPFTRTLVLCELDDECPYKLYCHGGEGHKSCQQCRKSHRRCHRDEMCCRGNTCQNGRCIPHQYRFDEAYNHAVQDFESEVDEESISQDTKTNFRKHRQGEACSMSSECEDGMCCAQHLWSKICKPMLEVGDVCTKKRDRLTDVFQRCECMEGLACKRDPSADRRLHVCQAVKQRSGASTTSKEVQYPDDLEGTALEDRERILTLPVDKSKPVPSKNGDFLEYLSAESGEKVYELAGRGDKTWARPVRRPQSTRLRGTAYRDTTEVAHTQQAEIEAASRLTVL